jgi:methylmalonyl-CoA/ethylmalonyl-CoA epimerase
VSADRITGAKLDHIAIGARRLEDATDLLIRRLGGRPHAGGPGIEFRGCQWEFEGGGRIEVIEPEGPPGGFLQRFIDARGPGVHHITFKVPDIYKAADSARAHGYTVVGFNDAFEGWKEMFLHPREAQGVVVQLAQSDPDVDDSWGPNFPFPSVEGPIPEAVRVLGVRLTTRSLAKSRSQWEGLLGGRCEERDRKLVFAWTASPLEITVELDDGRDEGPVCLEIEGADELSGYTDATIGVRLSKR